MAWRGDAWQGAAGPGGAGQGKDKNKGSEKKMILETEHEMKFHMKMADWHKEKMYECKDRLKMLRSENKDAEVLE